ncbi:hypothetical protein [Streptomyces sp. NRRL S-15]|uniref:hypothetical protein n=1 Tax=Streptomyces sp. NRRL S-15 TaxID=1463886 RepID=UPI0004C7E19D|nr:hypothetical protein [Streptomyces sp. NRRL S-15]
MPKLTSTVSDITRQAASHTRPTVDAAEVLMITASMLREHPTQILSENALIETVLRAAGPGVTTGQLRPVWEALPLGPAGDEHVEYARRLVLAALEIRSSKER